MWRDLWIIAASCVLLVGCTPCRPGETLGCSCEDGSIGFQMCSADGRSFDECVCASCGDGVCSGETCSSCSRDCGACTRCGDGVCSAGESCSGCATDCGSCPGPSCGDGVCSSPETCASCSGDCGPCAGRCAGRAPTSRTPCRTVDPFTVTVSERLYSFWGTEPRFVCEYLSVEASRVMTACGQALPRNASYCPGDVSISYDIDYLRELQAQTGVFSAVAFYAHEWGHLNQHVAGLLGSGSTKPIELHADCQMGVFMAHEELAGLLGGMDVMGTFQRFCVLGDPSASPWFAPGAHGTCCERTEAVRRGYTRARSLLSTDAICAPPLQVLLNDMCSDILVGGIPVC